MGSTRSKLLEMQRKSLRKIRTEVRRLEGSQPPDVVQYQRIYKRELNNKIRVSSKNKLLSKVKKAGVILGGDFHAFAQSQRAHLRILRSLKNHELILALEMFPTNIQPLLDDFMAGRVTEGGFLKKISYSETWGFAWENYRPLLEHARLNKIPVYGLNIPLNQRSKSNLRHRDLHAAKVLAGLKKNFPEKLIYSLFGDLHLAKPFLPRQLKKILEKESLPTEILTIFQNSEEIYWKLAQRSLEEKVDVVELGSNQFCVINSPPWIKWQSYLTHLEHQTEIAADGDAAIDAHDQVLATIKLLAEIWNVHPGKIDDFSAFGPGDASLFKSPSLVLKESEKKLAQLCVERGVSFFLPQSNLIYLSELNVNQISSVAGQYLHSKLRKGSKGQLLDLPSNFLGRIWIEAFGFFASKIVNHRRKSDTIKDMEQQVRLASQKPVTALLVLEFRLREKVGLQGKAFKLPKRRPERKSWNYMEASRILGALMGNRMYQAFRSRRLGSKMLQCWFKQKVTDDESFREFYLDCARFLKPIPVQEQSKHERL